MPIPEKDLARISAFCDDQAPPQLRDQVRVELRRRGRSVTIVEMRPPWPEGSSDPWMELPQARMTYDESAAGWTLYCFDANSRAHQYPYVPPHQPIERLLAEYERDPTGIFKG